MTPRSTFTRHLVTSAVLLLAGAPVFAQTALPLAELGAGMYRIEAEVAHTFETRQVGLMNRAAMPLHRGMVFVFPEARAHCMWMKNTPLPLSVAFVDDGGRVINVEDMQPHTTDNHCAAGLGSSAWQYSSVRLHVDRIAASITRPLPARCPSA